MPVQARERIVSLNQNKERDKACPQPEHNRPLSSSLLVLGRRNLRADQRYMAACTVVKPSANAGPLAERRTVLLAHVW